MYWPSFIQTKIVFSWGVILDIKITFKITRLATGEEKILIWLKLKILGMDDRFLLICGNVKRFYVVLNENFLFLVRLCGQKCLVANRWWDKKRFFKLMMAIDGWIIFYEVFLKWVSMDLTDEKWTLAQVTACLQALPEPILIQFYVAIWRH